ncbi:hypothetical protein COCON_G00060820 [Conger conger]|uniref:Cytochrome c oxidase assembly factor 7 n=1 Tax=Conger conger TaxID=82655 RepID=A0A9Q1DRF8_CONCO|nr:hypothetical protein COCON_G00060820 [Conger conger]
MAGLINFEDEKEVKQFLDNLGVEYSYQCHKEKDPEGCQRLADYLEGIKKNFDAAAQVLKHNCEVNGHGESCYKLGAYHITGKGGVSECLKKAYSCFMKSCESGGWVGRARGSSPSTHSSSVKQIATVVYHIAEAGNLSHYCSATKFVG